ncbi:DUF1905 domain-containing protein [Flavihumibacter stibioxidans]|uniref:DUF1905 domain-containing protein n=1 Tax=Flavihumibacter stibioxidans TaxID=1834163 RepID=UPI001FE25DF9|nr:DUF1905 domain-containing protein [Flavihumibacter stibioxidans]
MAAGGQNRVDLYIYVSPELAAKIKPGNKKSFRVKGRLDEIEINSIALIPIGGGDFIPPCWSACRMIRLHWSSSTACSHPTSVILVNGSKWLKQNLPGT